MKIRWVIEYFRKFKRYRLHPARETILSDGGFRSTASSRYGRCSYGQRNIVRGVASSPSKNRTSNNDICIRNYTGIFLLRMPLLVAPDNLYSFFPRVSNETL